MGIKERKERNRANMHKDILSAALSIVRNEGHRSLSLRRLADSIEFSATAVYLYFKNKEALLADLAEMGYQQLNTRIERSCKNIVDPRERLKAILTTYWHFAIQEKELYLLMQDAGTKVNDFDPQLPEMRKFITSIKQATTKACGKRDRTDIYLERKCYTSIALVQGLASIHVIHKDIDAHSQSRMLDDAIDCLIDSLN